MAIWQTVPGAATTPSRRRASFAPGHRGQGLRCSQGPAVVPDSPELRPAPGLRIECWVKLDALGTSWQTLLIKERAYQLRVDPPQEGGRFSFFLHLGGWEPRVGSKMPAKPGVWYHVIAGWDGKEIWIDVNGERTSTRRSGVPTPSGEPLELGPFDGVLDEVRIENPAAPPAGVAQWLFEGNLRDSSGHGYHLSGKEIDFVPVPGGQALESGSRAVQVASNPNLQLAPGFRIDCSVYFEKLPAETRHIAIKDGEYQLRLNSAKEGGCFAFFVNLDGWEPRVCSEQRVVPGQWYRLTAAWDGFALTLDVNGQRSRMMRSGLAKATGNPLVIGGLGGLIDNLRIENPRLPTLQVRAARQEHAILLAGRPEKLTTTIRNIGTATEQVVVRFQLPAGTRSLGPAIHELGAMPTGAEKTIAWGVEADAAAIGTAEIQVTAAGAPPVTSRHPLVSSRTRTGPPASASAKTAAAAAGDWEGGDLLHRQRRRQQCPRRHVAGCALEGFHERQRPGPRPRRTAAPSTREASSTRSSTSRPAAPQDNWAEIGAYGDGARPIIRRNWDIDDRCALVRNPDFLRIRSLVVCHAGKGLIVTYTEPGHRGLVIEDCIAHHIEGLYRFNAHGIPEWRDRQGAGGRRSDTSLAESASPGHRPGTWCFATARCFSAPRDTSYSGTTCSSIASSATTTTSTTPRPIRSWSPFTARFCGTASSTPRAGMPAPARWASCSAIPRA